MRLNKALIYREKIIMIAVCALNSSPWELNPFSYELPKFAVSDVKLTLDNTHCKQPFHRLGEVGLISHDIVDIFVCET